MNRKDDLFKVVFYPGADKREKGILGKILLQCGLILIELVRLFVVTTLSLFQVFRGACDSGYAEDTGGARLSASVDARARLNST